MATVRVHETHPAHHAGVADHTVGTMDITAHERTYNGFIRLLVWNVVAIAALLIFLALANS